MLEFSEFPAFTKRLLALAKERADDVLLEIENDLIENPERGPVIEGTAGVRKARVGDPTPGKGKSGFRYMYYYIEQDGQVFLLMIFSKNEQADLTSSQKKILKQAILSLREARK